MVNVLKANICKNEECIGSMFSTPGSLLVNCALDWVRGSPGAKDVPARSKCC
jgi:hypothetical protein